jgi:hypothetical protein
MSGLPTRGRVEPPGPLTAEIPDGLAPDALTGSGLPSGADVRPPGPLSATIPDRLPPDALTGTGLPMGTPSGSIPGQFSVDMPDRPGGLTAGEAASLARLDPSVQAAVLAQLRGGPSRPPAVLKVAPPAVERFNASAPPETLVDPLTAPDAVHPVVEPPSAGPVAVLKVSKTPIGDIKPSTSKAARDIGGRLSPNDLQYLRQAADLKLPEGTSVVQVDGAWKIQLPDGTMIPRISDDLVKGLKTFREARHGDHYGNAVSDKKYRQQIPFGQQP